MSNLKEKAFRLSPFLFYQNSQTEIAFRVEITLEALLPHINAKKRIFYMKCMHCNGDLIQAKDVFHADRTGVHLTIDELDVLKCTMCGDVMIDSQKIDLVQRTLTELENSIKLSL